MIKIENKQESLKWIKEKKLNHFGEEYFFKNDIAGVTSFLEKYPVKYYFLRELTPSTSNVFYNLSKEEVLEKCRLYEHFGLDISSNNYQNHRILCGEMILDKEGNLTLSGSINKNSTHRNFIKPNYFLETTLEDRKLKYIPTLDIVIDYFIQHELWNVIVEFCTFDIPLGTEHEKIIIYEMRTDY